MALSRSPVPANLTPKTGKPPTRRHSCTVCKVVVVVVVVGGGGGGGGGVHVAPEFTFEGIPQKLMANYA